MKRLILSLLAVCLLWMANAQNPAWGPQSKVVTDSIYSQVLKAHRAYTIYLPRNDYQNLSLANTGSARNVKITSANVCKALALEQEQKDTIDSHNIGLFTSRLTINEADFEHDLQTTLYMANCAAAVVINQQEVKPTELWGFVEGMATHFLVNDSIFSTSRNTIVRAKRINEASTA